MLFRLFPLILFTFAAEGPAVSDCLTALTQAGLTEEWGGGAVMAQARSLIEAKGIVFTWEHREFPFQGAIQATFSDRSGKVLLVADFTDASSTVTNVESPNQAEGAELLAALASLPPSSDVISTLKLLLQKRSILSFSSSSFQLVDRSGPKRETMLALPHSLPSSIRSTGKQDLEGVHVRFIGFRASAERRRTLETFQMMTHQADHAGIRYCETNGGSRYFTLVDLEAKPPVLEVIKGVAADPVYEPTFQLYPTLLAAFVPSGGNIGVRSREDEAPQPLPLSEFSRKTVLERLKE